MESTFNYRYKQLIDEQLEAKNQSDTLGIKYLEDIDLEVCDFVVKNLISMDLTGFQLGNKIGLFDMIEIGLRDLEKFGSYVYFDASFISSVTPIVSVEKKRVTDFKIVTRYKICNDRVVEDSGCVSKIIVPKELYEITGYFYGHELLHALKDINYRELVNSRLCGEVIPIFYEFMTYNPSELLKKDLIKSRIESIFGNISEYNFLKEESKRISFFDRFFSMTDNYDKRKKAYEYAISKVGCYLNSFYYAIILYHMYLENPKKILDLVNRVLKCKITTMDMLEQLGIYGDIRGETFEKELLNIRKLVK